MKIVTKRRLTYVTIAFFNFFSGVEYAVIFPSLWGYLSERFKAPSTMMGLIIASFSISGLFSNPLIGRWADIYPNTWVILAITNLTEVIGSFMYFMGINSWFLVASRLVSGLGVGGGAAILADVTRSTSVESRTKILSFVMASRQFGLIIGPAANFLFLSLSTYFGPFILDKYSAPGLFMTLVWMVLQVMLMTMYFNLTSLNEAEHLEQQLRFGYQNTSTNTEAPKVLNDSMYSTGHLCPEDEESNTPYPYTWNQSGGQDEIDSSVQRDKSILSPQRILSNNSAAENSNLMIESAEQFIISTSETQNSGPAQIPVIVATIEGSSDTLQNTRSRDFSREMSRRSITSRRNSVAIPNSFVAMMNKWAQEYLRDEIVIILGIVFASIMLQTSLEAIITPTTKRIFDYEELENSIIFLLCGIQLILMFVVISFLSKRFTDRTLILGGLFVLCLASVWFLIFIPMAQDHDHSYLPFFAVGCILDLIAIPLLVVCTASLLSKITAPENQALTHGFRRSAMSMGCIIGPLWGGTFLSYTYVLFGVPLGIILLFIVLYLVSYPKLLPEEEDKLDGTLAQPILVEPEESNDSVFINQRNGWTSDTENLIA